MKLEWHDTERYNLLFAGEWTNGTLLDQLVKEWMGTLKKPAVVLQDTNAQRRDRFVMQLNEFHEWQVVAASKLIVFYLVSDNTNAVLTLVFFDFSDS